MNRFVPITALTALPALAAAGTEPLLSARLKAVTAPLHEEVDSLLGLPEAIRSRGDYIAWLIHFRGLYEPLERSLARFPEWNTDHIPLPMWSHSACLAADLAALGASSAGMARAPASQLPVIGNFAQALGGLYVLEGATLGGRMILRGIDKRIGHQIAGGTSFFGGRGEAVGPMWHAFRASLDAFGARQPLLGQDVVAGAESLFRAILVWFAPFRARARP
jgi:heme oxygenase